MSAVENKAMVARYWDEIWNNKQVDKIGEFVAPVHAIHLAGGQAHRPSSIPAWVHQALISFPDVRFTIEDMIAEGDKVATRWSYLATQTGPFLGLPPTGKQVTDSGTTTVRIENGLIAEMWVNQDSLGLLQQLGAVRRPGPEGWGGAPTQA
jgi:predicted ester cyclase